MRTRPWLGTSPSATGFPRPLDYGESRSEDPGGRRLEEALDGVDDAAAADAGGVSGRLADRLVNLNLLKP